ncbi:MAG: GNAT family N-acetyltransferase [Melioribacteraceae bacterium]|nr:GNAT family N-acetyltransferase [Melioribacteraceae bacterium]
MEFINITLLIEKLYSGKESILPEEIPFIIEGIHNQLIDFHETDIQENFSLLIDALFKSNLHNQISEKIELGKITGVMGTLLNQEDSELNKKNIFAVLDLIRLSGILVQVKYPDPFSEEIYNLIEKSNFSLSDLIKQRVGDYSNKNLFNIINSKEIKKINWQSLENLVSEYGKSLVANLEKKDSKVAFLLNNSINMVILDLASISNYIVDVMIPTTTVSGHIKQILIQTESELVFVDDEKELQKIKLIKKDLPFLRKAILLSGHSAEEWVMPLEEFLKKKTNDIIPKKGIHEVATIMYTSGTTGEPKGIMFTFMNIVFKRFCRAIAIPEINDNDSFLAYLPMYHTFGRYFEMMGAIFWGAEYSFMENPSLETMVDNMTRVKPTIFISIPKKWMQLYDKINEICDVEFASKEEIIASVKQVTGGKLKWGLSAAGYLPSEIFLFFQQHGVELMSGFGMTEATGGITMTPPHSYKYNSLGKALPGIDIKVDDDGELLIKGGYVMKGYFKEDFDATFEPEGWFRTGDIMTMDSDGFIEIIDRKKEIYKNIKGETISPQKIENLFRDFEFIHQVFLAGDHRAFNTVLIYPNPEIANTLFYDMTEEQKIEYYASSIVTINKFLAPFERILDFRLIERPFSAEKGELTPKGTFKRRLIENNFKDEIDSMYTKNSMELKVGKHEIYIPNWFLREKGCLSRDIEFSDNRLRIPEQGSSLLIQSVDDNIISIGSFQYKTISNKIDLQGFLTNPSLWLGNEELVSFAGNSIFDWVRQVSHKADIDFEKSDGIVEQNSDYSDKVKLLKKKEEMLFIGLHNSLLLLQSNAIQDVLLGASYISDVLDNRTALVSKYAYEYLFRPSITSTLENKKILIQTASKYIDINDLEKLFAINTKDDVKVFDENVIQYLCKNIKAAELINILESFIDKEILNKPEKILKSPIVLYFKMLKKYGINHPVSYEKVRQIFVKYQIMKENKELSTISAEYRIGLREGFRTWLGANQMIAVDAETGEEYSWNDVISIEEEIDPEDASKLVEAISTTSVLREAIFLFSKGKLLRLDDIVPNGIWISFVRSYHDKSVYRVSIQTRFMGSYDILLNLNKKLSPENVWEEVNWLILAGSRHYLSELVEDFGGYWDEYEFWSSKFIAGDTVHKYILKELRRNEALSNNKVKILLPFFIWNASASYCNFWRLTGYSLLLSSPTPKNFIIPTHDYQSGTRVVSFSERRDCNGITDFFNTFYDNFVQNVLDEFPSLEIRNPWHYIFSGVLNTFGEIEGFKYILQFEEELVINSPDNPILLWIDKYKKFFEGNGFVPKQIFFAVKRFLRWSELNSDADLSAQAELIYDLYNTYNLSELEEVHPEARTKFFMETVFRDSNDSFKRILNDLIHKQKNKEISKEAIIGEFFNLSSVFELSEKENFFLTRLTYPFLKPTDTAAIIKTKAEGEERSDLVIKLFDSDGAPFYIRKPSNPKEISKLHQIFLEANLLVNFRPEHQFLVAVSERGFIIGGLFYTQMNDTTIHMDKIVVSNRYRRKGISEGLMDEFSKRLKNEGYKYLTTGFFRPEYFYRFGFSVERKYTGLVKDLSNG